jgi:hypothetical protein
MQFKQREKTREKERERERKREEREREKERKRERERRERERRLTHLAESAVGQLLADSASFTRFAVLLVRMNPPFSWPSNAFVAIHEVAKLG